MYACMKQTKCLATYVAICVAKNYKGILFSAPSYNKHSSVQRRKTMANWQGPQLVLTRSKYRRQISGSLQDRVPCPQNGVQCVSEKEPTMCLRLCYSPRPLDAWIPLKLRAWHLVFLNSSTGIISLRTRFLYQSNYPNRILPRNSHVTKDPLWLKKKSCQTLYELASIIPLGRKLSLNSRFRERKKIPKKNILCQGSQSETMPNRFTNRAHCQPGRTRSTNSDRM